MEWNGKNPFLLSSNVIICNKFDWLVPEKIMAFFQAKKILIYYTWNMDFIIVIIFITLQSSFPVDRVLLHCLVWSSKIPIFIPYINPFQSISLPFLLISIFQLPPRSCKTYPPSQPILHLSILLVHPRCISRKDRFTCKCLLEGQLREYYFEGRWRNCFSWRKESRWCRRSCRFRIRLETKFYDQNSRSSYPPLGTPEL